jgi:hypothetical protein
MPELNAGFQFLPAEYQRVLAQEQHQVLVEPLQTLVGEWNADAAFSTLHPQEVLQKWLGFRLDAGASIDIPQGPQLKAEANQEFLPSALDEAELIIAQTKRRAMTLEQALAFASENP